MSHKMSFLPQHPRIVKRIGQKSESNLRISDYSNKNSEPDSQIVMQIINKQKQQTKLLRQKVDALINKNDVTEDSLSFYEDDNKKMQILKDIEKAKAQQEEIMIKINNCEKVGESTTPEEYYLWQKKKKMDEFNRKLNQIQEQNKKQREDLTQIRQKLKQRLMETKQEIQSMMHQIQLVTSQERVEDFRQEVEEIDQQRINIAQEEYDALVSTIGILRENSQILSSQLADSIQSIEVGLRKSFENSRSSLIRQLQSIRRQVENSEPSSPQQKGKQILPNQAIDDYINKLSQIQQMLSKEQAEQASRIIKPFDWSSVKWEQYLGIQTQDQKINFQEKFEKMSKDYEEYQKQQKALQNQLQQTIKQTLKLNDKNFEVESARIKLSKILQSFKGK